MHVPKHGHWLQTKVILREVQGRLRVVGAERPFMRSQTKVHISQVHRFGASSGSVWAPLSTMHLVDRGHHLKYVLSSTELDTTARIKQPLLRCLLSLAPRAPRPYSEEGGPFPQTRRWVGINLGAPEPCFPTPDSCGQETW